MCNEKCEVVFNQYRKLYVIRVTWTRDPLCDIYVHFKRSSLNMWGKGALCTLHPTSIFLSLHLPWRQQTLLGFSAFPPLAGVAWTLTQNMLVLFWLSPSARLSNHRSEARENSTNLTAATTLAFTGLTRENTLCGYMCESSVWLYNKKWYFHLISFLHHG